jgi:hypothetical protein
MDIKYNKQSLSDSRMFDRNLSSKLECLVILKMF